MNIYANKYTEKYSTCGYRETYENRDTVDIGGKYLFGELWDGNHDGDELLDSGAIWIANDSNGLPVIAGFDVLEHHDILESVVQVTDIY